jgi:glycosyltransferase involved in cell wall biosynthesis
MTEQILVSIIIPAYNEANRLPESLNQVVEFLQTQDYGYEVIVVENGSTDSTFEIAQEFAEKHSGFRVIHEEKNGKGRAVRRGMMEAQGKYRFMCDADLSMPIDELPRFLPPNHPDADIIIASREAPGAVRYNEPEFRHFGGRLINLAIRLLALPGFHDTQCGFKIFRDDIAEDLFSCQTNMGWSFDIELLYVARQRGYKIVELPVPWYYSEQSHVSPIKDAIKMVLEIIEIRWNAIRGRYAKKV